MLLAYLEIEGHSMEPAILSGQFVLASSIPLLFSKLKIGDVIVFEVKNKLIIKRVKEIRESKILVSGDNKFDSRDFGWIDKKDVKGKIIAKL